MTKEKKKAYKRKWYLSHIDHVKEYNKKYISAHPEEVKTWNRENAEKYRVNNKELYKARHKRWRLAHKEKLAVWGKRWREAKPNYYKEYEQKNPEAIKKYRVKTKANRRKLGFVFLNSPFPNCHGHHIDFERVIYIPKEIHKAISHSVLRNRNMEKINKEAYRFLNKGGL